MPKFKVGDKVRLNQPYGGHTLHSEGVVSLVKPANEAGKTIIYVKGSGFRQGICKAYETRFDLVESGGKTDEELAALFRSSRKAMFEARNELCARGYSVLGSSIPVELGNLEAATIKKTVKTEVVL